MECYSCGTNIPAHAKRCPWCGKPKSKRVYIPLWGILGGLIGSFVGYSVGDVAGSVVGGLLGIAGFELAARTMLRKEADRAEPP
jgi:hypothetical protein